MPADENDPGNMYNGGDYLVGEAQSPAVVTRFAFTEAIASWNATTPDGTWIEVLLSARVNGAWTKWLGNSGGTVYLIFPPGATTPVLEF